MTIVVNARFLATDQPAGAAYFWLEMLQRITAAHPDHRFVLVSDRSFEATLLPGDNVVPVFAAPVAGNLLLRKWWYNVRLPRILRKYKADVYLAVDGVASLATRVPQCLVLSDLGFLQPEQLTRAERSFYQRQLPAYLRKAAAIITHSGFASEAIGKSYAIPAGKISIVPKFARPSFHARSTAEQDATREKYTGGKNYFLCSGGLHPRRHPIELLKAFSLFKKRQQSQWKLVLAGPLISQHAGVAESLRTYKYREDVILTGYLEEKELAALTAAAYALVYPSPAESFGTPVLEALSCGIPVITAPASAMEEIAGSAALYADPADPAAIAEKMMRLYKDEALRRQQVQEGLEKARAYGHEGPAAALWETIVQANA